MYAAAAACDRLVQEEALQKLHLLLDAGHKVLLVLPVHFSTVNHFDYYMPYQQRIRKLDEKQRLLVVQELVGTPPDLNSYRIRETVTRLRQAARSVMARVSPAASGFPACRPRAALRPPSPPGSTTSKAPSSAVRWSRQPTWSRSNPWTCSRDCSRARCRPPHSAPTPGRASGYQVFLNRRLARCVGIKTTTPRRRDGGPNSQTAQVRLRFKP